MRHPHNGIGDLTWRVEVAEEESSDPVHTAEVPREPAGTHPHPEVVLFPDPHALIRDFPFLVQRTAAFLGADGAVGEDRGE